MEGLSGMFGGMEAGGTKFVCAVGTGPDDLAEEVRFPTTSPEETLRRAVDFFRGFPAIQAIGVGSFGPVDCHRGSPTCGHITTTPKPGWQNVDVAGPLRNSLGIPVEFDQDVYAAALGEWTWGAGRGIDNLLYITIGTGIGSGIIANGQPMHGMVHSELGHIRLPRRHLNDGFAGACPFHGDCFEGLASGPAIQARWGARGETLPADHPAWDLEAEYIALALNDCICLLSPERIILGGGVMEQRHLLPRIRARTLKLLNNYVRSAAILEHIDEYIVAPALGSKSGVLGAIALAQRAVGLGN